MRVFRRRALGLAIPLLAFFSLPARSQNLLVNPGFDRDLSGWTVTTSITPDPSPQPGYVEASAGWVANDRSAIAASGGAAFHALAYWTSAATAYATQCVALPGGKVVAYGASFLTSRQRLYAASEAKVAFFASADCSGNSTASSSATSLDYVIDGADHSSNGAWLQASGVATSPDGTRSALFSVGARATGFMAYAPAWVDVDVDDAFFGESSAATWILPSSAKVSGAYGSSWTTTLTIANGGADDALVTLKLLGHDADGRTGPAKSMLVPAGTLAEYPDVLGSVFGRTQGFGAIQVTSSSANVVVQSETSTPSLGGTVGQALPALGPANYASATPTSLAPIRENASFRTNLVLANATEIPVIAHLELSDVGNLLGTREIVLPPLGMTQIDRVASAFGVPSLDVGRLSVSTPTPGGLVAAYASVIDNTTNDPRAVLPQDTPEGAPGPNLLSNPGFDRDLSGWAVSRNVVGFATADAGWGGDAGLASGGALLGASASASPGAGSVALSQCAAIVPGRLYGFRAWVKTNGWAFVGGIPTPQLHVGYFGTPDCSGAELAHSTSSVRPFNTLWGSDGQWYILFAPSSVSPPSASSALVTMSVGAAAGVHGQGVSAAFDDAFFGEGALSQSSYLPSVASINGIGGSYWTTDLTLWNAGPEDASVYLEFPGNGSGGGSRVANVAAGSTWSVPDVLSTFFQRSLAWGPLRVTATSPGISVSAETSTPDRRGGTLGQVLASIAMRDLIGSTPKSIAPVRDDAFFRTNLVVSNATESRLTVHVDLFDASGGLVGSRDVVLEPLAAAQIGGVGWSLGGGSINPGRLSVSTPTPGGLVAAYASVIDNVTNDPRTLLPR